MPVHQRLIAGCAAVCSTVCAILSAPATAATPGNPFVLTQADLARPGWIPAIERPTTRVTTTYPLWDGAIRAEWKYRPTTVEETTLAGAYGRTLRTGSGTADGSIAIGVSAQARAMATAAGSARATVQARWMMNVVINPFVNEGAFGMPVYMQLMDRFGCQPGPFGPECDAVELDTRFQHVTTGRFAHSVQPFHEGEATFQEAVTITAESPGALPNGSARFAGSAAYDVRQATNGNHLVGSVTPTGDWTAGDFTPFGPVSASLLSLYPDGDRRNGRDDPNGRMAGEALLAVRQASVNGLFSFSWRVPGPGQAYSVPATRYEVTIDQRVSAGFGQAGYGWGTVAADFDNTARTSVLALLDPTGALDLDPAMLQVFLSPVPEPSAAVLMALGLGLLGLGRQRRGTRGADRAGPCRG